MSAPAPALARPVPSRRTRRVRNVLGGVAALWILSGIYIVPADQQAVVTRFGRLTERRVMPGIHYALPWPIESVTKLKVQQLQRLIIGGESADGVLGRSDPRVAQFVTGDQNLIQMRTVVQ